MDISLGIWAGIVSITIGLSLLAVTSLGLLAALRLRGFTSNILGLTVVAYGIIVLQAQLLSELNLLSWGAILIAHGILAILTLPFVLKFGPALLQSSYRKLVAAGGQFKKMVWEQPAIALLGIAVLAAMILGAYLILRVPPNTTDSFLYHLARVANWLQQQTMHHFYAPNEAKVVHPINAEIGLFWLTALWGTDLLTGFLQWAMTILTMVAIYGISRQLNYTRPASIFAALIWSTLPVVVAQSTSTKNDLVVTYWVMASIYFLLAGLQQARYKASLILAGLAFGLAVGTKPLAFLTLGGLGIMAIGLIASRPRSFLSKFIYWGLWSIVGFISLGAYNYLLNWLNFGSFFGPRDFVDFHGVENPSITTLTTNLVRIGYLLVDPTGLPEPVTAFIQQWRPHLGASLVAAFDIDVNLPGTSWGDATFSFAEDRYFVSRDGLSWYGPLAILVLFPCILYSLVIAPLTHHGNRWRWFIALSAVGYIVAFAFLIRWHPYIGRLLMIGITLGAPLMAQFFETFRHRAVLHWLVTGVAIWILGWSATQNFHRPLLGAGNIWQADYYDLRTIERPYMAETYRYLDKTIPPTARLGVAGDFLLVDWDYLLFGYQLSRTVTHLKLDEPGQIDLGMFEKNNIDYLLLSSNILEKVDTQVPLWPVTKVRVEWYLAKRGEAELFAAPDRSRQNFEAYYGDDYRAYQKIKTVIDNEAQTVRVLTTYPRMPFYDNDPRFEFNIPQDLQDFTGYTHFIVFLPQMAADYERLGFSELDLENFFEQSEFLEKILETQGYSVFNITLPILDIK